MSDQTIEFLLSLLNQVTVSAGDPNMQEIVASIVKAREELKGGK